MVIVISNLALYNIEQFYSNVAKKYKHTYDYSLMYTNIDEAIESMYQIENGLLRREPAIAKWKGKGFMANTDKWYFLYTIEGDTVYVLDACHSQNMHEALERKIGKLIREYLENLKPLNENKNNTIMMNESEMREMISSITRNVIKEEYKVVGRNEDFVYGNGKTGHALITLKDEAGGESRVVEDDGCYVLYQKVDDTYEMSPFLYPEAFNAMKRLPDLPLH